MQNLITKEQAEAARALLFGHQHIVLFTHLSPDGDAIGSALGLRSWLQEQPHHPEVDVIVPNAFPDFLAWMPGADSIIVHEDAPEKAQAVVQQADLCVCLDFNAAKRIDQVAPLLTEATCQKLMIDHHLGPDTELVDVCISYPEAPATAFLVLQLINMLQGTISAATATCLYTGLMTDTGNFEYGNSGSPDLYEMVAQLIRAGIDKVEIYDNVFNQYSINRLRFEGYCIYHKMRIFSKRKVALIALSSEELKRFNFQKGDSEGIVNLPLRGKDIVYSVFMREDVDKIKISFRSQGDRPINIFAEEVFNGGGHKNAAGGESKLSLAETIKLFENTYTNYLDRP